jgi:tRNA threonylcarbamoyladenosine modification (KEOPS) complex  Pcc1 subunit
LISGEYKFCLGEHARSLYTSLLAELEAPSPDKGEVKIRLEGDCLILYINSPSLSGFRALSNSFLLLIHAAYSAIVEASRAG